MSITTLSLSILPATASSITISLYSLSVLILVHECKNKRQNKIKMIYLIF